ncbi:GNAT family N-acetyltransferase [Gallaecimonas sp. GXIMD4217]|uniref:GNAT family N-acetyltransferase n=1 Tax=Gallaecimonas sp. GXIMD4217 TaxID=3131927 RepID=UPI00311AE4C8
MTPPLFVDALDKAQHPLAKRFYKEAGYKAPVRGHDRVYVLRKGTALLACCRLVPIAESWLLCSLVVVPERRGQGLGGRFLGLLSPLLATETAYTFPFRHLKGWYQECGFVEVAEAPGAIHNKFANYRRQGRDIVMMRFTNEKTPA